MNRKTKNSTGVILTMLLFVAIVCGCSTTKNTFPHRAFHNVNARYNGYFYAKESIKEGVAKLENAHIDNYRKILPVYMLGDDQAAKSIYPEMDKTYKKASRVIQYHSIVIRGKEYVKWIDDNFLAIGISHFYKKDYFAAIEVFDYVIRQYKNENTKHPAMIWMVRANNELGNYYKSQQIVDLLNDDKEFPHELWGELAIAYADLLLKQEKYSAAESQLLKAIALSENKKTRSRLTFILAQIYLKNGDNSKASRYFAQVVKMNPNYEMAFYAKMNEARLVASDTRLVKARLIKMAKDSKNKEYFDQVYYTLAEVSLKEGNRDEAIEYLLLSSENNIGNTYQKSQTFLKLADTYFEKPAYILAQAYYDSAVGVLPEDYPGREKIIVKQTNLKELVANLKIIQTEDSLQGIARLSEKERSKRIRDIISDAIAAEEAKLVQNQAPVTVQNTPAAQQQTPQGAWYFYNASTKGLGIAEFQKKWGNRKLEDNWRRKSKESLDFSQPEDIANESETKTEKGMEAWRNEAYYLKNLPLSSESMSASNTKIQDAYFNVGTIYKEQLSDYPQAIKTYEELISRYDTGKYAQPSHYILYRLYLEQSNQSRSDYHKQQLLNRFPNSSYAKIILNPEFASESNASKKEIERFYEETYNKYLQRNYLDVIANSDKADSVFAKAPLLPKFHFLKALSIGALGGTAALQASLKEIVEKHPSEDVGKKAEEMLKHISNIKTEGAPLAQDTSIYKINDNAPHLLLVVFQNKSTDANALKTAVSAFNNEFYSPSKLAVNNLFLDLGQQIISVSKFANKAKALNYYNNFKNDAALLAKLGGNYKIFVITEENYPVFYKNKNVDSYLDFFNKKYLQTN